jgi:hypothetical protein
VFVDDVKCRALVDSGSQITTICEQFVNQFLPDCNVLPIQNLKVYGAGQHLLPYIGYIEVELKTNKWSCCSPILVVRDSYQDNVPIVIGTNVIVPYYQSESSDSEKCSAWNIAFNSISDVVNCTGALGLVKSTKVEVIPSGTKVVVKGLTRAAAGVEHHSMPGITEPHVDNSLPGGLVVTPSIVKIGCKASTYKISVEITNMSNKPVSIPCNYPLCELHRVDCMSNEVVDQEESRDILNQFHLPDNPEHKAALMLLLSKWKHIFAWDKLECGHTSDVKHRIELTDTSPVKLRYRRIPPSMYNEVRQHINELLEAGHIRPSKSPWSFPLVLVRKADQSLRMCVDYRLLNRRTIRDAYSLPRINDTMDSLSGSSLFSCLDMKQGYYQVEVAEEHKERTAFSAGPLGFWEFNSMPFGLTNSPATFQRMIESCMGNLNLNECLVF